MRSTNGRPICGGYLIEYAAHIGVDRTQSGYEIGRVSKGWGQDQDYRWVLHPVLKEEMRRRSGLTSCPENEIRNARWVLYPFSGEGKRMHFGLTSRSKETCSLRQHVWIHVLTTRERQKNSCGFTSCRLKQMDYAKCLLRKRERENALDLHLDPKMRSGVPVRSYILSQRSGYSEIKNASRAYILTQRRERESALALHLDPKMRSGMPVGSYILSQRRE